MGCCASVLSHNVDNQTSHTQERISHTTATRDTSDRTTQPRQRTRHTASLPLNEHYNEPVRNHVWYSKRRTWTRAQLDRERTEFFETRVTGRPEIWAAVSTVISLIRNGDLATAQGILDAAGITVPTGDLCEGCYDEQGVLYRVPQCVVSDPENIVPSSSRTASEDGGPARYEEEQDAGMLSDSKLADDDDADASGDELISQDVERRREEKGKTSERDLIRVLARLSDRGGPDILLSIGKGQTVGFLARRVHQEAKLEDDRRVRIAYLGHLLNEREPLVDQGWKTGHIVNALISPVNDLNLGHRS
ncbi:hypothetical protein CBS147332_390 [Penicillium roqueforti]|nr:hypothetical protein CBS147318_1980 [Penicillium roqueforti]KAI2733375.1 hypothetical protein CBS147332_390 [Penicillium roqueforti]KAI3101906.1 hypothetical protein CBS147331_7705 [Penicillium roqueforti]KAI3139628.1 hypothetical protein CBS147330_1478 [Penicillium roqueforti]KAI3169677.1 hypothetical protein DTO039G3_5251 [Penicillium roqueforti]